MHPQNCFIQITIFLIIVYYILYNVLETYIHIIMIDKNIRYLIILDFYDVYM